jgi:hypothetical protein
VLVLSVLVAEGVREISFLFISSSWDSMDLTLVLSWSEFFSWELIFSISRFSIDFVASASIAVTLSLMAELIARLIRDCSFLFDVWRVGARLAHFQHHGHCHVFRSSSTDALGIEHLRLTQKECQLCLHDVHASIHAFPSVDPPHGQSVFFTFLILVSEFSLSESLLKGGKIFGFGLEGDSRDSTLMLGVLLLLLLLRPRLTFPKFFNCPGIGEGVLKLELGVVGGAFPLVVVLRGD